MRMVEASPFELYARATMDPTQDARLPSPPAPEDGEARERRMRAAAGIGGTSRRGLLRWTLFTGLGAIAACLLQHADVALFLAAAALFALAQSWDLRDRGRTGDSDVDWMLDPGLMGAMLRLLIPFIVPIAGALTYGGLAMFARSLPYARAHVAALHWSLASAAACAAMAVPPPSRPPTR